MNYVPMTPTQDDVIKDMIQTITRLNPNAVPEQILADALKMTVEQFSNTILTRAKGDQIIFYMSVVYPFSSPKLRTGYSFPNQHAYL